jgi:flagellar biosynthesis component FlhA
VRWGPLAEKERSGVVEWRRVVVVVVGNCARCLASVPARPRFPFLFVAAVLFFLEPWGCAERGED